MKSIERRFERCKADHPGLGSFITLGRAVQGQNFTPRVLAYWFNRLVEKGDFIEADRRDLLQHLLARTGAEDGMKAGSKSSRTRVKQQTRPINHSAQ